MSESDLVVAADLLRRPEESPLHGANLQGGRGQTCAQMRRSQCLREVGVRALVRPVGLSAVAGRTPRPFGCHHGGYGPRGCFWHPRRSGACRYVLASILISLSDAIVAQGSQPPRWCGHLVCKHPPAHGGGCGAQCSIAKCRAAGPRSSAFLCSWCCDPAVGRQLWRPGSLGGQGQCGRGGCLARGSRRLGPTPRSR